MAGSSAKFVNITRHQRHCRSDPFSRPIAKPLPRHPRLALDSRRWRRSPPADLLHQRQQVSYAPVVCDPNGRSCEFGSAQRAPFPGRRTRRRSPRSFRVPFLKWPLFRRQCPPSPSTHMTAVRALRAEPSSRSFPPSHVRAVYILRAADGAPGHPSMVACRVPIVQGEAWRSIADPWRTEGGVLVPSLGSLIEQVFQFPVGIGG